MKIRWLVFESCRNPETGELFMFPSKYRKLQVLEAFVRENDNGWPTEGCEWIDVPEVTE